MTKNNHIQVSLTPNTLLIQALKGKNIEEITKLTIIGRVTGDDFLFIRKNMAETLLNLDISNVLIKGYVEKFFELTYCSGLKFLSIPDSIVEIEYYSYACFSPYHSRSFKFDSSLKFIAVHPQNPVYASEDGVLFNKDKTELILYPPCRQGDYVIPNSVTKINQFNLKKCTGLTAITIPNSIIEIGFLAFNCCPISFTVHPDNPVYGSKDGKLYKK